MGFSLKLCAILAILAVAFSEKVKYDHDELMKWEPPTEYIEKYPYYLSGYDEEKRPIWIISLGHWDMEAIAHKDAKSIEDFEKYVHQMLYRLYDSPKETGQTGFIVIEDMEGYTKRQLMHRNTLKRQIEIFKEFSEMEKTQPTKLYKGYGINLNLPAKSAWGFIKPTLGELGPKITIFGNKKWEEALLKDLPKTALPPWLGGFSNFTEIPIFGKRKFHITKYMHVLDKDESQ